MLGDLGRALRCDTLFYTASTWGLRQAAPAGEMVDLRVKGEATELGTRGAAVSAAERAAALLQLTSRRLSLPTRLRLLFRWSSSPLLPSDETLRSSFALRNMALTSRSLLLMWLCCSFVRM